MSKKVIFLDIDGTLVEGGSNVPPKSALEAIRKAQRAGNAVFLCTGRNYKLLKPLLAYDFDGMVASAGAYVEVDGKVICDCPMNKEQVKKAIDMFEKNDILQIVECRNEVYINGSFEEIEKKVEKEGANSELRRWIHALSDELCGKPWSQYQGESIYKISFMHLSKEQLVEPKEVLGDAYTWVLQKPLGIVHNGELSAASFDKGTGIKKVCEYLQIPIEDSYGFGDSMNDFAMMLAVGTSICMENGDERLKAISSDVCPAVGEDGLYQAFEKYHLF